MSRNGHRGIHTCPICGETYVHTNFMVLRNRDWDKSIVESYYVPSASGVLTVVYAYDTHIRSCARKRKLAVAP